MRDLRGVEGTDEESIKAYWREHYIGAFTSIIQDLQDRLDSPLIKVFVEIEEVLINAICAPDIPLVIEEMEKCYGDRSGVADSPLHGMTAIELKEQLSYLRTQWNHKKKNEMPQNFQDVLHMVTTSFKNHTPLDHWKVNAPFVLIVVRLIIVAAGTSAFAERTLSLSCRIKTWLRAHMDDSTFANLGLLAWYKDEVDEFIDPTKIGNEYISVKPGRKITFGTSFSDSDFYVKNK